MIDHTVLFAIVLTCIDCDSYCCCGVLLIISIFVMCRLLLSDLQVIQPFEGHSPEGKSLH